MGSCFSVNVPLDPFVTGCFEFVKKFITDWRRPKVVERNLGHIVGMELELNEALKKIKKRGVQTVGIYGMGGVGKTTLLGLINNKLKTITPREFDVVIFVTVSKDYKKENVQEAILKFLGLDDDWIKNKKHEEKVEKIFGILSKTKFALLLDDVWKGINLAEDIGVPKDRGNGSKVVFTTRDWDVCGEMEANEDIKVKPLKWEKAWELFKTKIGDETLQSDRGRILDLAKDVAKECDGLPIAIITIASAMARKRTYEEWRSAFTYLRTSASKFRGMKEKVFGLLKFSYDELSNDKVGHKPCFLYCCLFPEDWNIPKMNLIDYWICEELCSSSDEGYEVIGNLVRASLLEEEGDECVKMHDVVRDMALWLVGDCDEVEDGVWYSGDALVEELESLGNLNVLTVSISVCSTLDRLSKSRRLSSCIQELNVQDAWDLKSVDVVATFAYMEKLEVLDIENCDNLEELKIDALRRNGWPPIGVGEKRIFENLRYVIVYYCDCLSDLTWLALAPNLTRFEVCYCRKMTEIINSEKLSQPLSDVNLFGKLQRMELDHLPLLKSICLNSLPFPNLEVIEVTFCPSLKKLPLNSSSAKDKKLEIKGDDIWSESLEWENEDAKEAFSSYFYLLF